MTIEEKMLQKVNKRKRKRRNRKIVRFVFLLCTVSLFVLYLVSDSSKVRSLTVQNNVVYSDEEILKKANLDYQSSYLLTVRYWVNHLLKSDSLIKDASMSKDLHGGFTIYVEEEKIIGYLSDKPSNLLVQGKGLVDVKNINVSNIPRLSNFTDKQLEKLDDAFNKVKPNIVSMISEILPHSESYNAEMVKIIMNDGNRITTSYEGIYLMNQYKNILPQLKGTHVCLFMDEYTGNIIKQSGKCEK